MYIYKVVFLVLISGLHGALWGERDVPLSEPDRVEWALTTLWESRYVAEGVDELGEGGLFSAELVAVYGDLEFTAWAGLGDGVHFQELDLTAAYGFSFVGFDGLLGYTHLEFEPDSGSDDELFLELGHDLGLGIYLGLAAVYSFEADGSFLELELSRPFQRLEERLTVTPYLIYALDLGYRTDVHDGPNHLQCGLECRYQLTETIGWVAYAAHSFALRDLEREGLGDVTWFGFGLSAVF